MATRSLLKLQAAIMSALQLYYYSSMLCILVCTSHSDGLMWPCDQSPWHCALLLISHASQAATNTPLLTCPASLQTSKTHDHHHSGACFRVLPHACAPSCSFHAECRHAPLDALSLVLPPVCKASRHHILPNRPCTQCHLPQQSAIPKSHHAHPETCVTTLCNAAGSAVGAGRSMDFSGCECACGSWAPGYSLVV